MSLEQHVLVAPDDGSRGPLLRIADDRLLPGQGYGRHPHRAVDVVAVVLAGELSRPLLRAGDVGVLRSGTGLEHDEIAGDDGARVLQTYLRSAAPHAAPEHEVAEAPRGWVDLERPDALLWVARLAPGTSAHAPAGLRVVAGPQRTEVADRPSEEVHAADGVTTVVVWQLDTARPEWAEG